MPQHYGGLVPGNSGTPALPALENEFGPSTPTQQPLQGEPNVSPEEQAAYEQFVNKGYELIYGDDRQEAIKQQLAQAAQKDPVMGLAGVASAIVRRLKDSAEKAGKPVSPDVLLHGGTEILEDLADLAKQNGIHDFTDDELEKALLLAMDMFQAGELQAGKLDPAPFQQDMIELEQQSKDGTLAQEFPGLSEKYQGQV